MRGLIPILNIILVVQLSLGANVDSKFAVDPDELQLKEISENMRKISGAVMGLAEYVLEIRSEIKSIRADIVESRTSEERNKSVTPSNHYQRPTRDPVEFRRQSLELADKVEKLLAMEQSPEVDLAKEELRKTVEKNFLRMLAAILVTGPAHTQDRSEDIFKLMRSVLNGEIDFTPVVQRLPLILRDSETNQFVNLLITLRESERKAHGSGNAGTNIGHSFRQGLTPSAEVTVQNAKRQTYNNFPNHQFYNTAIPNQQPQFIPGAPQYVNVNNRPINNVNNLGISSPNTYNPNLNTNNYNPNLNTNNYNPNLNTNTYNPNINTNANNLQSGSVSVGTGTAVNPITTNNINTVTVKPTPSPNQLPSINSIIDGINQTNQLLKEIPTLVEGLQTLVESLEGIFNIG